MSKRYFARRDTSVSSKRFAATRLARLGLSFFWPALLLLASFGCAITDYPIVTDDRGDYSGVIRTGHPAYITPTTQLATTWPDGSDETFSLVYQNQNGDQMIYTKNNFDFSASVLFMDQTYCDWRTESCEITSAWNPAQDEIDDPFDFDYTWDCSGARSMCLLMTRPERIGECGDGMFWGSKQDLFAEFADLTTTTWRGGKAYVVPINYGNTSVRVTAASGVSAMAPIYGQFTGFVNEKLQTIAPVTPNVRHELRWLRNFVSEYGPELRVQITYGDLTAEVPVKIEVDGLDYNTARF